MAYRFFEGTSHAAAYAKFRPVTADDLIERVVRYCREKVQGSLSLAVDVGCGSGQSTELLSQHFEKVLGTDISKAQVEEARKHSSSKNVTYKVAPAEEIPCPDSSACLVSASQACHWFDLPRFFKDVERVLVPGGVLALYGYHLPKPVHESKSQQLWEAIEYCYDTTLKDFVQPESREVYFGNYKEDKYKMPFADKSFQRDDTLFVERKVTLEELTGYLSSWSGFQKFKQVHGDEEAAKILEDFQKRVSNILETKKTPDVIELTIRFNFFLLLGRKPVE